MCCDVDPSGCNVQPPVTMFPFAVANIGESQCYQLTSQNDSACFQSFWALHGPQYTGFCVGVCPPQFNLVEAKGA